MISLDRRDGRLLRIGHRGAPVLAPENTIESFRAALEHGVDLVEFDVIRTADDGLVVAHDLEDVVPDTPTLDAALRFFAEEAPDIGLHLDLKLTKCEPEVVAALRRYGLQDRAFVSSYYLTTARSIRALDVDVRTGFTVPRRMLGISEEGRTAPLARVGLRAFRWLTPTFVAPLLAMTRTTSLVLHHAVATSAAVRAAHTRGASVVAWTVDDPSDLVRVERAGVDAVVTNDPRIFAPGSLSTLRA